MILQNDKMVEAMKLVLVLVLCVTVVQSLEWAKLKRHYETRPILRQRPSDVDSRIIGGTIARRHQFPHHVGVVLDRVGFCSGSHIAPNIVITVAHCARGASIFDVIFGAQNIDYSDEPDRQEVRTTDVTMHPDWNYNMINNDIAVLVLPVPVSGTGVAPALVPRWSQQSETFLGQMATVSGWGKVSNAGGSSSELRYVNLTVISNSECFLTFGDLINESKLCVDTEGGIVGVCGGDSGGPLVVYEQDGQPCQIGIVSFGGDGCESGEPAVFTRLTSYLGWLETFGVTVRP
ncbi:hypothetical protein B566_EDAN006107 [Ephemera danica]|nr:hypothetical protein B566_EDAN006107 [Ephemera danica]